MTAHLRSGVLDLAELSRFPNEPVRVDGSLFWDAPRLWLHFQRALEIAAEAPARLDSIGVDAWGCDYGLLGENGELVGNPYHYRDARTDGVMEDVCTRVSRERLYDVTGIQNLAFNTIFQLVAAKRATPRLLDAATRFGTIPDILNYWLTGVLCAEFTSATTTQMIDARRRDWAFDLLRELDLPVRLLPPIVEPGSMLGPLKRSVSAALAGTPVVVPACHDTGSAVAAVPASGGRAFLSSGTWSLLGTELPAPILTPEARDRNFTNEGGVCGTIRLLKNIGGLWLLQACRRSWQAAGQAFSYEALLGAAADERHAFRSLIDPDHEQFVNPDDMPSSIDAYCRRTGQAVPEGNGGYARAILESLACRYRVVLESLEAVTGRRVDEIRIVGGGSRNRLLNQFTADATGRRVIAGPVEATALGNIAMQMLAIGAAGSLDEARDVIARSFPVERFEPVAHDRWEAHSRRFKDYVDAA
jgi:rhamnulokinase